MCHHADTKRRSAALVLGSGRVLSPALPFPRRIADDPSLYLLRARAPARGALLGDPRGADGPVVTIAGHVAHRRLDLPFVELSLGVLERHPAAGQAISECHAPRHEDALGIGVTCHAMSLHRIASPHLTPLVWVGPERASRPVAMRAQWSLIAADRSARSAANPGPFPPRTGALYIFGRRRMARCSAIQAEPTVQ